MAEQLGGGRFANLIKSPLWPALVSALVAPGAGQILNREFKKGIFLLTVIVVAFAWFFKVVFEQLALAMPVPPDQWAQHAAQLEVAVTTLGERNRPFFTTFYLLTTLTWVFGVVDAYIAAKHLRHRGNEAKDEGPDAIG